MSQVKAGDGLVIPVRAIHVCRSHAPKDVLCLVWRAIVWPDVPALLSVSSVLVSRTHWAVDLTCLEICEWDAILTPVAFAYASKREV